MDELDLNLDQTERIAKRVANGVYRLSQSRKPSGEELWSIFGLKGSGYRLMSEIDLRAPVPNQQRAKLDLESNWALRRLWVEVDAGNARRTAIYQPDKLFRALHVQITESLLRYADTGKNARDVQLNLHPPQAKLVFEDTLPFDENTHLDFGSTLFNFAYLKRMGMRRDKAQINVIVVKLPSLEPMPLKQTYEFVAEKPLDSTLFTGKPALCYRIIESDGGMAETQFWADNNGIILKQEVNLKGQSFGCELTNYRWLG